MNYQKVYDQLVEKCKPRGLDRNSVDFYTEIHHVIPRCLGGDDSEENLVMFSGREHYIAHMLLWKIYPKNKSIAYAARFMSLRTETSKVSSKIYENLKSLTDPRPTKENSPKFKNKVGQKFGRLTVLSLSHWVDTWGGNQIAAWKCECSCGKFTTVLSKNLSDNGTKSCGCLVADVMKQPRNKKPWVSAKLPERWIFADTYYNAWVSLGQPDTSFKFSRLYNEVKGSNLNKSYFKGLVLQFNSGWIPSEDSDWINFKEEYS